MKNRDRSVSLHPVSVPGRDRRTPVTAGYGLDDPSTVQYAVLDSMPMERRAERGLGLGDLVAAVRRRKWTVAAMVLLFGVLAAAFVFSARPFYTAEGLLLVGTQTTNVADIKAVVSGPPLEAATVRSEIEMLKSPAMAQEVTQRLELWNEEYFRPKSTASLLEGLGLSDLTPTGLLKTIGFGVQEEPIEPAAQEAYVRRLIAAGISAGLEAAFDGRSYVIRLRFSSPDPALSARIVNEFMKVSVEGQLRDKSEAARRAKAWLRDRLAELQEQTERADQAVEAHRTQNKLTEARGLTLGSQELTELNTQLVLASAERSQKEANLRQVRQLLKSPDGAATAGQVLASPTIQRLGEQETDIARKIAEASVVYGKSHPTMVGLLSEQKEIARKLAAEVSKVVQNLSNEMEVAGSREMQLRESINELQVSQGQIGEAEVQLRELQRKAEVSRRIYETFLTRELEITGTEDLEQADSRIVSAAQSPLEPSFPKKTFVILLAVSAGALAGVFLAFLFDSLDDTFKQPRDIVTATGLRPIGFLPAVASAGKAFLMLLDEPRSSFSEAVRSIRTSLSLLDRDVVGKIILVASSVSGEGKSLLAASIARSVAQAGGRALLVDCDLRRPSVGELLKDTQAPGLAEHLQGESALEQIVRRDNRGGMDYILATAGRSVDSPPDLLASPNMRSLLSRARSQYDVVVLDAPPVLAVSDPVVLSRFADAIVFVIRWRQTSKDAVASALDALRVQGAPIAGAVLSHMNVKRYAKLGFRDGPAYRRAHAGYYR